MPRVCGGVLRREGREKSLQLQAQAAKGNVMVFV